MGAVGAPPKSQGTPGKAPPPGPPRGVKPEAWVTTLDRAGRWRHGHGAKARDEDHIPGSSREPSREPPTEQYNIWTQDDFNVQDGKRIRLSPRIIKEQ